MSVHRFDAGDLVRHLKSGGEYEVRAMAKLEATLEPVIVYRSLTSGEFLVRPGAEFCEDRFSAKPAPD